jgi:hypothetical protein
VLGTVVPLVGLAHYGGKCFYCGGNATLPSTLYGWQKPSDETVEAFGPHPDLDIIRGEKAMVRCKRSIFLILLMGSLSPFASSQLRSISEFTQDRINNEKTFFILHETGEAEYAWTSEWTTATAYAADGKSAILVWYFKDGSKAYSEQGTGMTEIGKSLGYSLTNKSRNLEDIHRKKIQPLTRDNYPVKIELWIGEIGDSKGYAPEAMGDEACFKNASIEYNISNHFSSCRAGEKEAK